MRVWLDGGWGVDALLGRQTRPHDDMDIVIEQKTCLHYGSCWENKDILMYRGMIRVPGILYWATERAIWLMYTRSFLTGLEMVSTDP